MSTFWLVGIGLNVILALVGIAWVIRQMRDSPGAGGTRDGGESSGGPPPRRRRNSPSASREGGSG